MKYLVPYLPDNAPFTQDQRAWLNGYFAGWAMRASGDGVAPGAMPNLSGDGQAVGTAEPMLAEPEALPYDHANPFPARLLTNRPLNGDGSAKDVRHIEISLEGSDLTYEVGDALAVIPQNCPDYVDDLLAALAWSGEEPVDVDGETLAVREALTSQRTVTEPPRALLDAYAESGEAPELRDLLDDREALGAFLWGRDVLDLALAYTDVHFEPQAFVDLLRPFQYRLYSISSSPNAHPGEVHLTVGTVRYETRGRTRKGVCSTFLADRCLEETLLPIFVHRNTSFRLPDDPDLPVIMIGPGTGIAPFRAFLEERRASDAAGKNWLFFGDQHAATDFLYQDEIEGFFNDGTLDRLDLAWSRDGNEKVYVQHRMLERADELFAWLEEGAYVYVCGDASRMAKGVDAALHRLVETAGGLDTDGSKQYVRALKKAKRYLRDVY